MKLKVKICSLIAIMIIEIIYPLISFGRTEYYNDFILDVTTSSGVVTKVGIEGYTGNSTHINIPSEIYGCTIQECNILFNSYGGYNTSVETITFPDTVENIAIGGLTNLKKIDLSNNANEIILNNLISLKNIDIPKNTKSLRITNCGFEQLNIPTGVENLYLSNCNDLTELFIPINQSWIIMDNNTKLKTIRIADNVDELYADITNCYALEYVELSDNLKELRNKCFSGCTMLQNIDIPASIKEIPTSTFSNCTSLMKVQLHEGLETIGSFAFENCENLKSIFIPKSVIKIEDTAFRTEESSEIKVLDTIYGYKGTYAETYANENGIEFIPLDGIWASQNISEKDYILTILGKNGKKLSGSITATIDEIEYICKDGIITFDKTKYDVGQEITLKVNIDGEDYTLKHKIQESGKGYIKIPENIYELTTATANGHEVLTSAKILNLGAVAKIEFELETANSVETVKYEIWQNNKLLTSQTGVGEVKIDLPTEGLEKGKNLEVKVCNLDGKNLSSQTLKLSLIKINVLQNKGKVELGKDIKVKLPNYFGPLTGAEFEIPFGSNNNIPIMLEMSDEKIKIGITTEKIKAEDEELNGEEFEKNVNEILNANGFTNEDSLEVKFTVYNEMSFDNGILKENKSFGALAIKLKKSLSYDTIVWVIPVTMKVTATLDGKLEVGVKYNFDEDTIEQYGKAKIAGTLQANAGIGVSSLSAGVYGKIKTELKLDIMPNFEFDKLEFSGQAGVYAEIFGKEQTIPIIQPEQKIVMDRNFSWTLENAQTSRVMQTALYNSNLYTASARSILAMPVSWNASQTDISGRSNLLADGIYTYANPKIVSNNTDIIMLFIDNDTARDEYNFKELKYSIYDKANKTWGEPIKLDENNTQDNNFEVYTNGTDIYVIYAEEKIELTENSTIQEYAANQEISVAKWNSQTKQFTEFTTLTNNDTYDFLPSITIVDNIPIAVWANNSSNEPFGTTTDNSVMYSKFENNSWTQPQNLISGCNAITELDVGKIGEQSYIVGIIDVDNDLATETDRNIVAIDLSGNQNSISTSENANIEMITYNGNNVLTWYSNGNINILSNINETANTLFSENEETLTSNNTILKKGENLVIVYVSETEEGNAIYQIIQEDNGTFGKPIIVSETLNSINCYGATFEGQDLVVCYTETTVSEQNGEIQKSSNLYSLNSSDKFDIEINNIEYNRENIIPNETTNISVYVKNNAEIKANTINVEITDNTGKQIYNNTFNKEILSGKIEKLELQGINIGEAKSCNITITEPRQNDVDLENNKQEINVEYSDLDVTADQIVTQDGNYALVTIRNQGNFEAKNINLNVISNGVTVHTIPVENVLSHSSTVGWVLLEDEYFTDGRKEGILTFEVTTTTQELYETNNKFTLTAVDHSSNNYLPGDVNEDGKVNIIDVGLVNDHVKNKKILTGEKLERADVDGNGRVNIIDVGLINDHIKNKKLLW